MLTALNLSSSLTETQLFSDQAFLALNHATPVETTQAVLLEHHCFLPVAALAAEQVAAADVHGRAVAYAPPRSQRASFSICDTEIRRLVRVDQVLLVRRLYVLADRDQGLAVVAAHHLGGAVETLKEAVAYLPEMRHLLPARAQGTRPRQSVAFALCPHVELYRLGGESKEG